MLLKRAEKFMKTICFGKSLEISNFGALKWLNFYLRLITMDQLGSVAGPVIQANGRLTFEDDLRSGGLLCFTAQ